ncbi:MAG: DUF2508 family protein [Clostridia bacterium]|nr:DUF2508 family protein [Clostridia bacterium]
MGNVLLKRGSESNARDKLLEEIQLVKIQLQNANTRFEQTSDSDLVEAAIYEIESLKARYRYLVKSIKVIETT